MHSEGCIICGKELVYSAEERDVVCSLCGKRCRSSMWCPDGHYVCDDCCRAPSRAVIVKACLESKEKDPIKLAESIMRDPSICMHGPEHHILDACALATAYKNCGGDIDLEKALPELVSRMSQIPGGVCGRYGCCGAAIACGAFVSVATGATPLSGRSWGMANTMTSRCLAAVGSIGGPRCCKRDAFLSLTAAARYITENMGVEMRCERPVCTFHTRNQQCLGKNCPFNPEHQDERCRL